MIFTGRIIGPAYEGYHKVDFRPVNLEWHNLTEKEGMQRFSQLYYLAFKSLQQLSWSLIVVFVSDCISFHLCLSASWTTLY